MCGSGPCGCNHGSEAFALMPAQETVVGAGLAVLLGGFLLLVAFTSGEK